MQTNSTYKHTHTYKETLDVGACLAAFRAQGFLARLSTCAPPYSGFDCVSRQRAPCLLSIVIAASCALLFAIATDELFNGPNSNGEISVGLCVEGPVLLNIWELLHRSRQSSYYTQFILTDCYECDNMRNWGSIPWHEKSYGSVKYER
jgi:hypothetical protein